MFRFTDKQVEGWSEAMQRLSVMGLVDVPKDSTYWTLRYDEETRPGRGHLISATYVDSDVIVQVIMDVYGYPCISWAHVDWVHSDSDEACKCDYCLDRKEAG